MKSVPYEDPTLLDVSWAEFLLDKYEEDNNKKIGKECISCILRDTMEEEGGFYCDKETFKEIVRILSKNYL